MKLSCDNGQIRAELSRHWIGDRWVWRLTHKRWGGPGQSRVQYQDYVSEENALRAFIKLYG